MFDEPENEPEFHMTYYRRPYGNKVVLPVFNVAKDDAKYIQDNNVKVSSEDDVTKGGGFVIYFDDGTTIDDDPDEDPDEIIVFSRGRTCNECMAEGVRLLKERRDSRAKKDQ